MNLNTTTWINNEFENQIFNESYTRIYKCLSLLDEKDLWRSPNEIIPSVGNLILHLCGNARQWILSTLDDLQDNRQRDQEFLKQQNIKKTELVFLLENLRVNLKYVIQHLNDEKLNKTYQIQCFQKSGWSILIHVIEHFSYHTGQITLLTKMYTSQETEYYKGKDLNQIHKKN